MKRKDDEVRFVQFDCAEEPLPKDTTPEQRPAHRPRQAISNALAGGSSSLQSFDTQAANSSKGGAKAERRPQGRERKARGVKKR